MTTKSRPIRFDPRPLELLLFLALLGLLGSSVWYLASTRGGSPSTPSASGPGLELLLSGAVTTSLSLQDTGLTEAVCTPSGFRVASTPQESTLPFNLRLSFAGAKRAGGSGAAYYFLGADTFPLTLRLSTADPALGDYNATFRAYDGRVTVTREARIFTAFLADDLGRTLYASGRLSC